MTFVLLGVLSGTWRVTAMMAAQTELRGTESVALRTSRTSCCLVGVKRWLILCASSTNLITLSRFDNRVSSQLLQRLIYIHNFIHQSILCIISNTWCRRLAPSAGCCHLANLIAWSQSRSRRYPLSGNLAKYGYKQRYKQKYIIYKFKYWYSQGMSELFSLCTAQFNGER